MAPIKQHPLSDEDDPRPATAFRITINGKPYCETDDLTTVTMVVDEVRGHAERRVTLYASGSEGPLRWMTADLAAGDRIAIEIVDAVAEEESAEALACDFCGRAIHAVHVLVQGTDGNICDLCIERLSTSVRNDSALPVGASFSDDSSDSCAFCGKAAPDIAAVIMHNSAAICAQCLRSVDDMMSERASSETVDENET
jgi:hypothetical protein